MPSASWWPPPPWEPPSRPVASLETKPAPTTPSTPKHCEDGRWIGPDGTSVEGRPDNFDAGDAGAAYIWHDGDGWHLRTSDARNVAHHYSGTIRLSKGASFHDLRPVRNERDDKVWLTGDNLLHYSLRTFTGIDGFDFRVSACDSDREHETMRFSLDYKGREDDPRRIDLGDSKRHPDSATFLVRRSV